jgi:hypothetical protein
MVAVRETMPHVPAAKLDGEAMVRIAMQTLGEDYKVFYHPQQNKNAIIDPYDRELDIAIVHRTKGILAISTKFGEVTEEQNGVINQFQPRRNYYKIMDPARQAKSALADMLGSYDASWKELLPVGAAVFLPDTHVAEFYDPKSIFFFQEDISGSQFQVKLDVLFPYPFDTATRAKFEEAYVLLCNYLKQHSASENPFENRRQQIKTFTETHRKRAYAVPETMRRPLVRKAPPSPEGATIHALHQPEAPIDVQQASPVADREARAPEVVAEVIEAPAPISEARAAPEFIMPPERKEVPLKAAPHDEYMELPPLLAFFRRLEDRLHFPREQAEVILSPEQWLVAIAGAVGIICAAYFSFHNLGVAMAV